MWLLWPIHFIGDRPGLPAIGSRHNQVSPQQSDLSCQPCLDITLRLWLSVLLCHRYCYLYVRFTLGEALSTIDLFLKELSLENELPVNFLHLLTELFHKDFSSIIRTIFFKSLFIQYWQPLVRFMSTVVIISLLFSTYITPPPSLSLSLSLSLSSLSPHSPPPPPKISIHLSI